MPFGDIFRDIGWMPREGLAARSGARHITAEEAREMGYQGAAAYPEGYAPAPRQRWWDKFMADITVPPPTYEETPAWMVPRVEPPAPQPVSVASAPDRRYYKDPMFPEFDPSSPEARRASLAYTANNPVELPPTPYTNARNAYERGGQASILGYMLDAGNTAVSDYFGPKFFGERYARPPEHFGPAGDWNLALQGIGASLGIGSSNSQGSRMTVEEELQKRMDSLQVEAAGLISGTNVPEAGLPVGNKPSTSAGSTGVIDEYTGNMASDDTRQQIMGEGGGGGAPATAGGRAPAGRYPSGIEPRDYGWYDEFTRAHGGETMEDYYMRVDSRVGNPEEAKTQAVMDRNWSIGFARKAGRPPNRREWVDRYYQTGGR